MQAPPPAKTTRTLDEFSQIGEFTPASGLAASGSETETTESIQRVQVSQTVRAIPLLLLFHASAAVSIHNLSAFASGFALAGVWHAAVALTGMGFAALFFAWRLGHWHDKPAKCLRVLEVLCLALGLVWATPAAASVFVPGQNLVFPVIGISLAMLGIAAASLMRIPTGAIVFIAVVTAALARSLYMTIENFNSMSALICSIYGLVLVGITINSHFDFLRRSKAEIEVQRQNEVIRLLLKDFERDARDWLWETDTDGRLTYFSKRFADVLEQQPADLRLRPLRQILANYAPDTAWRTLDAMMSDQQPITNFDMALEVAGKNAFWQISAHPLRDSKGRYVGYRGVCRDVTAAQEAQRRIEAAMDISERANAAKSQFLAVMSHELRTPINAIVGFSELLTRDKDNGLPAQSRREFADTILESSRHLQSLINDILDVTRMERGTMNLNEQDMDAAEVAEVAIKLCREQAERSKCSIVARLVDGVTVRGDTTRLKQVIINLLTNAIKFSPDGSIINVEMQKGLGGQFVLAVKDAGIGISKEDLKCIFEPFVQADSGLTRNFGGVGLGLPIARRIARLHDGDVTLDSEPGAGTTALLVLPALRITWPGAVPAAVKQVA